MTSKIRQVNMGLLFFLFQWLELVDPESTDHLLFMYPIANVIWGVIALCFHQKRRPTGRARVSPPCSSQVVGVEGWGSGLEL
jgi:hypothetical protein